jgi:hypothetical protein
VTELDRAGERATDDVAADAALLAGIVQSSFNLFGYLSWTYDADDAHCSLTDDDASFLRHTFQSIMESCHMAAARAQEAAVAARHVELLQYNPQNLTSVAELLGTVHWLFREWPDALRGTNQRLPASQWMIVGSFFRQGLVLLSGELATGDQASSSIRGPVVSPTAMVEELVDSVGVDEVLRRLTGEPDDGSPP